MLVQVVFAVIAPRQVVPNLVAGAIAEAGANQAGDMMQVHCPLLARYLLVSQLGGLGREVLLGHPALHEQELAINSLHEMQTDANTRITPFVKMPCW